MMCCLILRFVGAVRGFTSAISRTFSSRFRTRLVRVRQTPCIVRDLVRGALDMARSLLWNRLWRRIRWSNVARPRARCYCRPMMYGRLMHLLMMLLDMLGGRGICVQRDHYRE